MCRTVRIRLARRLKERAASLCSPRAIRTRSRSYPRSSVHPGFRSGVIDEGRVILGPCITLCKSCTTLLKKLNQGASQRWTHTVYIHLGPNLRSILHDSYIFSVLCHSFMSLTVSNYGSRALQRMPHIRPRVVTMCLDVAAPEDKSLFHRAHFTTWIIKIGIRRWEDGSVRQPGGTLVECSVMLWQKQMTPLSAADSEKLFFYCLQLRAESWDSIWDFRMFGSSTIECAYEPWASCSLYFLIFLIQVWNVIPESIAIRFATDSHTVIHSKEALKF